MHVNGFRPIYYLGCKNEFTQAIRNAINEVDPTRGLMIDLFAGTGSVSASLNDERKVVAVDIQEYSRTLCSAVLNPANLAPHEIVGILNEVREGDCFRRLHWCFEPLIELEASLILKAESGDTDSLFEFIESAPIAATEVDVRQSQSKLLEARSVVASRLKSEGLEKTPDSTVSRFFGGVYFSFSQSIALDAFLSRANSESLKRDTLVAAALSTASSIVNTVGKQFAQPIRPRAKDGTAKSGTLKTVKRDRSMDPFSTYEAWLNRYSSLPTSEIGALAVKKDYLTALKENAREASVIYADPPYTRDHYSRFYHVLETMCLRDEPEISPVKRGDYSGASRGVYRMDRHQSDFCIRSKAPSAFDALFRKASQQGLPVVLSYSPHEQGDGTHPRVVSTQSILEIARQHYSRVEITELIGSSHNNLNSSALKLKDRGHAELLIKCSRP